MGHVWKSCWYGSEEQNGGRVSPVHVYTDCLSVENSEKLQNLYGTCMEKLLEWI